MHQVLHCLWIPKSSVSKVWPAGQMCPANWFYVAHSFSLTNVPYHPAQNQTSWLCMIWTAYWQNTSETDQDMSTNNLMSWKQKKKKQRKQVPHMTEWSGPPVCSHYLTRPSLKKFGPPPPALIHPTGNTFNKMSRCKLGFHSWENETDKRKRLKHSIKGSRD